MKKERKKEEEEETKQRLEGKEYRAAAAAAAAAPNTSPFSILLLSTLRIQRPRTGLLHVYNMDLVISRSLSNTCREV